MLAILSAATKARLEGLASFKVVEQGFSKRALQSPPSAVFFLVEDELITDSPSKTRRLTWEIAILASYLDPVRGQATMDGLIDQIRPAFSGWRPVEVGSLPTTVPRIRYEGIEDTLLIYTARVTMEVFPESIS